MFTVWSDNALEAEWFRSLDARLNAAKIEIIGGRGSNPAVIERLISYDRPDVILLHNGSPILVLEKTREVPTGHNVGQRFARLARAAELSVPVIFFLPFDARKHGRYSSMCRINTRLLRALLRMGELHSTYALAVNWPCDQNGELVIDGSENFEVGKLTSEIISEKTGDASIGFRATFIERQLEDIQRREEIFPKYKELPKSAFFAPTHSFLSPFLRILNPNSRLLSRERSLVYKIDMSPEKAKRQDPYTGTQFIYDYGWLRKGASPADRDANLILWIPRVDKATWERLNPETYASKSCNWYLIADAIVLSDGVLTLTSWGENRVN